MNTSKRDVGRRGVPKRVRYACRRTLLFLVAALSLVWALFPFYWMVVSSLRPPAQFFSPTPSLLPGPFTLEYYRDLFRLSDFLVYYKNSVIVAVAVALLTIVISSPLAYVLARYPFPMMFHIMRCMFGAYMLPPLLIGIPLLAIIVKLHVSNTLTSLVLAHLSQSVPFGGWLLWSFFRTVPFETEESAMVDGASRLQALTRITLPLSLPGVATVAIFSFIVSWQDYTFALLLISSDQKMTLPVGLSTIAGGFSMRWGEVMAGTSIVSVPVLLVFCLLTRYFIRGLTAGAVKG
jgi:multiple sugar transport system permease protein